MPTLHSHFSYLYRLWTLPKVKQCNQEPVQGAIPLVQHYWIIFWLNWGIWGTRLIDPDCQSEWDVKRVFTSCILPVSGFPSFPFTGPFPPFFSHSWLICTSLFFSSSVGKPSGFQILSSTNFIQLDSSSTLAFYRTPPQLPFIRIPHPSRVLVASLLHPFGGMLALKVVSFFLAAPKLPFLAVENSTLNAKTPLGGF